MIRQAQLFQAKKHLGQHFLIAPEVLEEIAQTLEIGKDDSVLEIGPGLGFLTNFLCQYDARITAVELDQDCVSHLTHLNFPGLNLVHGDFLSTDLLELMGGKFKVAGNVPYQITSPILAHLFGEIDRPKPWRHLIERIVLTVQREVAERFVAEPGSKEYSQITLLCQYYSKPELVRIVERENFTPIPEVTSAVVKFTPLERPAVSCGNSRLLRQLIRAGFGQRRKMLRNNLSFLKLSARELDSVFAQLRLDPQARAEGLSLQQFAALADAVDLLRAE